MSEVSKMLKLCSYELGEDFLCKLNCFEIVTEKDCKFLLNQFNSLKSVDKQNL